MREEKRQLLKTVEKFVQQNSTENMGFSESSEKNPLFHSVSFCIPAYQLVCNLTVNQGVVGSSPTGGAF